MMVLFTQMEELGGRTSLGREEMVSGLLDRLSEGSVKSLSLFLSLPQPQHFINMAQVSMCPFHLPTTCELQAL